jgi:hypothetical protein
MGMTVDLSQVRGRIANLSELIKGNERLLLHQSCRNNNIPEF